MSAGPWQVDAVHMSREVEGLGFITAWNVRGIPGAAWRAEFDEDVYIVGGHGSAACLDACMEAADLWASENGYPAVRVEVDP